MAGYENDEEFGVSAVPATRALFALGLGGFAVGTGEFALMGLLPNAANALGRSVPATGHLISLYALGVVVGAPTLAVLTARWPRRLLLITLMTFYAVANLATALAPGFSTIAVTRFAAGFPHGAYFGVAALVAAALVPPAQRARAVGFVMLGLTAAMLVGMPLATWLGQLFGWRAAFAFVGGVAVLAAALIRLGIPHLPAHAEAHPMRELGALKRPQVWLTLAVGAIGFGGLFCVFSYISPMLVDMAGLKAASVPLVLAIFGGGSVAGNLLGARMADRALVPTIAGALIYAVIVLSLFGPLAHHVATAVSGVFLLGGIVALGPALQVRLMDVAGDAQTLAAALNHSAFNIANALGAWLGGVAIAAAWGWASLGWIGVALAFGGILALGVSVLATREKTSRHLSRR